MLRKNQGLRMRGWNKEKIIQDKVRNKLTQCCNWVHVPIINGQFQVK